MPAQPAPAPTEAPAQQEETIAEDTQDETLPEPADAADLLPHQMSEEVSQIMDEADALAQRFIAEIKEICNI